MILALIGVPIGWSYGVGLAILVVAAAILYRLLLHGRSGGVSQRADADWLPGAGAAGLGGLATFALLSATEALADPWRLVLLAVVSGLVGFAVQLVTTRVASRAGAPTAS